MRTRRAQRAIGGLVTGLRGRLDPGRQSGGSGKARSGDRGAACKVHLIDRRLRGFGAQGAQGRPGHGGRGAVSGPGQRVAQRRDDQPAHQTGVAEPNLGLGGVDVDVDKVGRAADKKGGRRVSAPCEDVHIGGAQGPGQQLVAHRTAVDEKVLVHRGTARIRRQSGVTGQADAVAGGVDFQGVGGKVGAHHAGGAGQKRVEHIPRLGVSAKHQPSGAALGDIAQGKAGVRLGQGQSFEGIAQRARLGPVAAQELQPRRGAGK